MELKDIMQKYVNLTYDELVAVAKEDIKASYDAIKEACDGNKENIFNIYLGLISTTMAADGKFTELEYQFFKDCMFYEGSYEDAKEVIQISYSDEMMNLVDGAIDCIRDANVKSHLLSLCLCAMSVDEKISREETAYLYKLMD